MLKRWGVEGALVLVGLALVLLLGACGPTTSGIPLEQVQVLVATSVAQTVQAQNSMGTAVAMTVSALAPAATTTTSQPESPLFVPTLTPLASVTPFMVPQPGSAGAAATKAKYYACDSWTVKPGDYTAFKPGDPFDIKWIITNTGTADMRAGLDLEYMSGTQLTTHPGVQLPLLKPHDTYTFTADGTTPLQKGNYVMTWKVEGGLCFPYVAITSGRPGIDP